jgi:tetratricopeptide (TPR) repeat protein
MTDQTTGPDPGQQSKAKVFISYSRKDILFVDRLEKSLRARTFEPLVDRSEIFAFEQWWERIEALIARADTFIFVLSPDSVASEVALQEVSFAASLNKRFAPIVRRAVDDKAVPHALAKLNFLFFDDDAQFEASANLLAVALSSDIGWIRRHTDFGELARRWSLAKRPAGFLLRSPDLDEAESWIAARPIGAPAPTEQTQAFIRLSRQAASRRRSTLTASLAAGLVLALGLAGLAYWQRGVAVEQRGIAERNEFQAKEEQDKATRNFKLAQKTAESLVFDIVEEFKNAQGMRAETVHRILDTAAATFGTLVAAAPDDLDLQRSQAVLLSDFGSTYLALGELSQALESFRGSIAIGQRLAKANPSNPLWQYDLGLSTLKVGDVMLLQGDLASALQSYQASKAINEQLTEADSNIPWLATLTICYRKIGDVLLAQRNLEGALQSYRGGLGITERAVAANPNDTQLQENRTASLVSIGDVLIAQGKLSDALESYRKGLAIMQPLAKADPNNTQWQIDLSWTYNKVGDVLVAQGNLDDALKSHRDGLAVVLNLVKMDPSNKRWQNDLSTSYGRIGDSLVRQGKLEDALVSYRDGMAIMESLVKGDFSNTQWQGNLALIYSRLALVYQYRGDTAAALVELRRARDIAARLVAVAPDSAEQKTNLTLFEGMITQLAGQRLR